MIGFIGLSHLGIVYSLATAAKGFEVLGFDPDPALCAGLSAGTLPVSEPGLEELFHSHRSRVRFSAEASDLTKCDLVFFSLDVPTDQANQSDLQPLRKLVDQVAGYVSPEATVVILCQVPPGFTRSLNRSLTARGIRFRSHLFYQVETLVFGGAVERALRPERFIVGVEDPKAQLPSVYSGWLNAFGCPVLTMRWESAELAKIAINMFLVASVSTTNTLAELCERIGADWSEIALALRLDRRIGPHAYLSPGLGIGGGNLERDLSTVERLAESSQTDTGIVDAFIHNSLHRREWAARTLRRAFQTHGIDAGAAAVAVWGLAYKENTDSIKNSPSLVFISSVPECRKLAYDPAVRLSVGCYPLFEQRDSAIECCKGADALVILTPWPEFRQVDLNAVRAVISRRIILDPFGLLDGENASALGFDYYRLGVPARAAA